MDCEFFLKQPSIFEIICEENLSNSIKAAIKKFIKVCFSFILFTHFNQKLLCKSVRMAQWTVEELMLKFHSSRCFSKIGTAGSAFAEKY